ncbi:IucA/IucC family C-terminal-domain containing protein [Anoxybacillus ayderensis]|uniref:IucA/IucC family C-terminal-domain containing protein n=1 Tax=Anoxybacillus ayderensis TaxID=265546 RepID=UPI002E1BBA5D|nr:IucA/IucC family C-terminal-domain containing protein [Anoxybacillus ayderensis]
MMKLSEDEMKQLERFRFSKKRILSPLSIRLDQLHDERELAIYLQLVQQKIGARNQVVSASIFMKRYSFFIAIVLYMMSVWNKRLSSSFQQIWMETDNDSTMWMPTFHFESLTYTTANENRDKWRTQIIEHLFAGHLALLMEQLRKTTNISPLILWENVSVYVIWLYETLLEENQFCDVRHQIYDDFLFVVQKADGKLFGPYSENPLYRFWKGESRTRRTTCCLFYQTAKQVHCQTCPIR